jgi:hypothetical protein
VIKSSAFDTYWVFAAERQAIYERRLRGDDPPWTRDVVLENYRFTNPYRVTDRVSQYLIREVQYGPDRSQEPTELFFRTLLFKIFNKIDTWKFLESELGSLAWRQAQLAKMDGLLSRRIEQGVSIYSPAYIIPAPNLGHERKHSNHIELLQMMMLDELPKKIGDATSLKDVYDHLCRYPGLGRFLSFQFAIDLNYSSMIDFDEADFVVAGPGAMDGIAKCFSSLGAMTAEDAIDVMAATQESEFSRLGLDFRGLFGRRLQPVDCQNIFCEVSKYTRATHPEIRGTSGRQRIKQNFSPSKSPIEPPVFPPKWGLETSRLDSKSEIVKIPSRQLRLL